MLCFFLLWLQEGRALKDNGIHYRLVMLLLNKLLTSQASARRTTAKGHNNKDRFHCRPFSVYLYVSRKLLFGSMQLIHLLLSNLTGQFKLVIVQNKDPP